MNASELIQGKSYSYQINSDESINVRYLDFDGYWYNFQKDNGNISCVNQYNLHRITDLIALNKYDNIKTIDIFTESLDQTKSITSNMRGIDLLPIEDENKTRLKEFALQYKKFARIIVEVISVTNSRIIVRVEQKEAVNNNFLSKKELEERVRDMFKGEIPEKYKLTISAVDFDRRDIEAINIEFIVKKMGNLNLKQKDLCAHLGIDKSSLSLTIGEQRELTKWQKACFYYFFKYYEQSNFK